MRWYGTSRWFSARYGPVKSFFFSNLHVFLSTCIYTFIINLHAFLSACIYTFINLHAFLSACIYTFIIYLHAFISAWIFIRTWVYISACRKISHSIPSCLQISVCVNVFLSISIFKCVSICINLIYLFLVLLTNFSILYQQIFQNFRTRSRGWLPWGITEIWRGLCVTASILIYINNNVCQERRLCCKYTQQW